MDSGNSGSMQSSSGGEDQDHEVSRPESVPVYLNSPVQFGSSSDPNQILHHSLLSQYQNQNQNQHQPAVFDHLSSSSYNYDHHLHTTLSQVVQPNPSNANFMLNPPRSNQPKPTNPILNPPSSSSAPQALLPNSSGQTTAVAPPRSSKKRSRASRRAPTTVLTTDTSNFRAMVQEFTGIPAPPFSATSSSYSRRLDTFGPGSTRSPLYPLLRPSPQKLHQPTPFLSSSPSSNSNNSSLFMMNHNITSNNNNNFMTSNFEFNQGAFPNMQTPILTFDSSPPPLMHSSSSSSINVGNFGARPTRGLIGNLAMHSSLEDQLGVGMSHHGSSSSYVNPNQRLLGAGGGGGSIDNNHVAASDALRSDHDHHHDVWRDRGVGSSDGRPSSVLDQMRPNSIPSSITRGEGTVNSWISPNSD